MSIEASTIVLAAGLIAVATAGTASASSEILTKTFTKVMIHYTTASFEPGPSASTYCKGKGYGGAASYEFGFTQGNGWHAGGRAFYPSISCLRGLQ